ncbi:hypothetical protein [Rhodoblastus sp.]|uniref:hypothetical protein n=1 Tax=Rhodoblastus sp. TaxID=1962975 RepID=UPI003F9A9C50
MVKDFRTGVTEEARAGLNGAGKPYLAPFSVAVKQLGLDSTALPDTIIMTKDQFLAFLAVILKGVSFDEDWYLTKYPDIADAIARGVVASARTHFVENGYIEGRFPARVVVDEGWYHAKYADVAEGVETGDIRSCQEHFDAHGRAEGRTPFKV